jgi:hypothetical protein
MFTVVSNGWVLVRVDGSYTWSTVEEAKNKKTQAWFDDLGQAIIRAASMTSAGVMPLILEIATKRPKRQTRQIICCGDSYLASRQGNKFAWERCQNGNIIKVNVALFESAEPADAALRQLTREGRGSIGGRTPNIMKVRI